LPLSAADVAGADAWHERLVRYYRYFGFEPVYTVGGNGLADWPHLLVWGGEGTRMDADVAKMLRKWTPAIRRSAAAAAAAKESAGGRQGGSPTASAVGSASAAAAAAEGQGDAGGGSSQVGSSS
jgi:hypothetical protein